MNVRKEHPRDQEGRFCVGGEYAIDAENGIVYGKLGEPITSVSEYGYVQVMHGGQRVLAHRMIWEAVHGPIPERMTVNHINGIKIDNRISNLELLTVSENLKHAYQTGLIDKKGEAHPLAKLDEEAVMFIRRNRGKYTNRQFAVMFGVGIVCVSQAANGRRWKHLPME